MPHRATLSVMWIILAALELFFSAGCSSIEDPDLQRHALAVPAAQRDRVYPIFLNSQNDPLGFTGFRSLANFSESCGFANTRYHHFDSGPSVAQEVREILAKQPDARICLIGWSGACLYAFDAAEILAPEKITLDELIYLDSDWVKEQRLNTRPHPTNVGRVALLYSENRTAPTNVPRSVVFNIPTPNHLDVATNPRTVEIVMRELMQLAQGAGRR